MLHFRTNTIEEYTIELAFSNSERYPVEEVPALPEQFAKRGVSYLASRKSCRFRLPDLWRTSEQRDEFWWEITPRHKTMEYAREFSMTGKIIQTPLEESLSRVVPSVSDAFDKIRQYGIPFFDGLAKCRGVDPSKSE
jgi:hypothetical protein